MHSLFFGKYLYDIVFSIVYTFFNLFYGCGSLVDFSSIL